MGSRNRVIVLLVLAAVVTLIVGILIGYFARGGVGGDEEATEKDNTQAKVEAQHSELARKIDAKSIGAFLEYLTKHPHIAGSPRNNMLATYIGDKFKKYGFDKVEYPKYNVLLSNIPDGKSNILQLINTDTDAAIITVQGKEPTKDPGENDPDVSPPFLGYSPSGIVEGDLVYVNYGRIEDFKELEKTVDIKGKIAIMRFGKIYRGNKVKLAAEFGAVGAILYNDPIDSAPLGVNETYPKTWWLPGSSSQRGSIFTGSGDPLTPGLPAVNGTFRLAEENASLPAIPAHTLNYDNAAKFLAVMGGAQAPESWRGSLPGVNYNLGPGFTPKARKVKLQVNNENTRKDIYNVIGTIIGKEEPDRYVLLGNHRDSWIFGAVDPSSGTSSMLEIARGLGDLLKAGWRPRRTIKLCSWGGEEYGLVGSYEWVEENAKLLSDRAVSYINIDIAVMGNYSFKSAGTPLLKDIVYDVARQVDDPNGFENKKTVYDVWSTRYPSSPGTKTGPPAFRGLGAGSDYAPIYQIIGIAAVDIRYAFSSDNVTYYPVYHTMHDSFHWLKTFVDPNFVYHQTTARMGAGLLLRMADEPLLPFTFTGYGAKVVESFKTLRDTHGSKLTNNGITLQYLEEAVDALNAAVKQFDARVKALDGWTASFTELRMINDQMMQFERSFMEPAGLPGRLERHVIFAPSMHDSYASSSFPGVSDQLFDIDETNNWSEVKKQMSFLTAALHTAARMLGRVH